MQRSTKVLILLAGITAPPLAAQQSSDTMPVLAERRLEGPRVGATYISGPVASASLRDLKLSPLMTLFGWHFEQIAQPEPRGLMLVAQEVIVVAGIDQGAAIPSSSFLVGMRFPDGFEFGVGPNFSPLGPALAMGVGKSLRYGRVTIPVDFAIVRSQGALRTTILVGYAIRRS